MKTWRESTRQIGPVTLTQLSASEERLHPQPIEFANVLF